MLISIIIPVYNVEKYVEECINSVILQDYSSIEIIIINDGSTDNSLEICKRMADRDSRVKLYTKKNGGLSDARNMGIEMSSGEYLLFLDSDDYISTSCISTMLSAALESKADIVSGGVCRFNERREIIYEKKSPCNEVLNRHEAMKEMLREGKTNTMACAKLYKRKLFDSIRFDVGKLHEDIFIMHKIFDRINLLCLIKEVVYYYRLTPNSISTREFSVKRQDAVDAEYSRLKFVEEKYPEFLDIQLEHYVWNCVNNNYLIIKSCSLKKNRIIFLDNRRIIKENLFFFLKSAASIRAKLFSLICIFIYF